jgi:LAO/AO transport system kinase
VMVMNKAGHPMADRMVRDLRAVASMGPKLEKEWEAPILITNAVTGEGVDALAEALAAPRAFIQEQGTLQERRRRNLVNEVLGLATVRLRIRLEARMRDDPAIAELLDAVVERRIDPASAARHVLATGGTD